MRQEFPWVSSDSTTLLRQEHGNIQWWTFAGGIANTLLADSLKATCSASGDNFCVRFPSPASVDAVSEALDLLSVEATTPIPNPDAIENLKFSECLPPKLAVEVFLDRFSDPVGVEQALREPKTTVVMD